MQETGKRGPGFALVLAVLLILVGGAALLVLKAVAARSPTRNVKPTPVESASGQVRALKTRSEVRTAFLDFIAAGDTDSFGQAMCSATGQRQCRIPQAFPGSVQITGPVAGHYVINVTLTVNLARLEALGEVTPGALPGMSNIASGDLAVSTNNAIYGIRMNPQTHRASFRFFLGVRDRRAWATNWNALGIVSQSTSLQ